MEKYPDLKKGAKIKGYKTGSDYITVWLKDVPKPFTYSHNRVGVTHTENMKNLAREGHGLYRYIKKHVNKPFGK